MKLELTTASPTETREIGRKLGQLSRPGDWIGLTGELGAGKTCLVQGLALGAGVAADIPVTSPTFVVLQTYPGRLDVHHLDLYRIDSMQELEEIGYEELIDGEGLSVVEWCQKIEGASPDRGVIISLQIVDEKERDIIMDGKDSRGDEIIEKLKELL